MSVSIVRRSPKNPKIVGEQPLEEILQSVSDLENAIKQSSNNDSISQVYRSKLCEILTTLLLSQPSEVLVKHDVASKLWTLCFYTRINQFRERMAKERRREERAAVAARGTSQQGLSPSQQDCNSEVVEKIFKVFLSESINMYGSLITKFKSSEGCKLAMARKDAKIYEDSNFLTLYSLYLRHGDLHRYTMNFQEAEKSYHLAIELLPGIGEAFNHLGVISQQKEQHFLSLYYYSRSLFASSEPFALSQNNLHRLFAENSQSSTSSYLLSSKDKSDKHRAKEMFLKEYVSLNRMFLSTIFNIHKSHSSSSAESCIEEEFELIVNSIDTLLKNLHFLLKYQYLGDGILLKMTVINVFTIVYLDKCVRGKKLGVGLKSMDREKILCLPSLALNFAYRFAVVINGQLRQRMQASKESKTVQDETDPKQTDEARANANYQWLRHLPSIQLFCDWLFYTDTAKLLANYDAQYVSEQAATIAKTEQNNFKSSLLLLWSDLKEINEYAASLDSGIAKMTYFGTVKSLFKEHFALRGFAPFGTFVSEESHKSWVYLKADHELRARIDHIFQFLHTGFPKEELKLSMVQPEPEDLISNLGFGLVPLPAFEDVTYPKNEDDDVDDVIVYKAPSFRTFNAPVEFKADKSCGDFGVALHASDNGFYETLTTLCPSAVPSTSAVFHGHATQNRKTQESGFRPPPGFAPPGLRVPQSAESSRSHFSKMEPGLPLEIFSSSAEKIFSDSTSLSVGNSKILATGDGIEGSAISRSESSMPLMVSSPYFQGKDNDVFNRNQLDLQWTSRSTLDWRNDYEVGAADVDMHATFNSDGLTFPFTRRKSSRLPAANPDMKPDCFFRFNSVPP
jgi:hypothetical protein